jgi:hypothetical protein
MPVIRYEKPIGDRYLAAEFIRPKEKQLVLLSYLKRSPGTSTLGMAGIPPPRVRRMMRAHSTFACVEKISNTSTRR